MADLFKFPDAHIDRDRMTMVRTPLPDWTDTCTQRMARSFGVEGKLQDAGSRFLVRDRRSALEFYQASDSVWWTRLDTRTSEPTRPVQFSGEREAIRLAEAFLRDHDLYDGRPSASSVTYTEASRIPKDQAEIGPYRVAQHVNFTYLFDAIPVVGPGAKTQVTFGARGSIVEAYRFWRRMVRDQEREIVQLEDAIRILRQDVAFANLREAESRVVVDNVQLAYYALPAREAQGYLVPVYAFSGTVTTPALDHYEFTKRVVAVSASPEDVKRLGAVFAEAPVIF